MKIIDFHTHPYLAENENLCIYRDSFNMSTREAKVDLERAGIMRICGSVISKTPFDCNQGFKQLIELNRKALELTKIYEDFYVPGFHVHPGFVDESLEEMEFMHESGIKLIGELVPYSHGWEQCGCDFDCDGMHQLLEAAGKYHMIVSYHTMVDQQEQMTRMIKAHPDVTFVAAHPGTGEAYFAQLDRIQTYKNAFLDLSGTGLFRYGMLRAGVNKAGADKIVFGTDYPICNPEMYVHAVLGEHLSKEDTEKIFHKNVEKIFNE